MIKGLFYETSLIIKFIMTEQGNRTQQLIYRTSYRKHRERLADIRPNITANDFLPPKQAKKFQLKDRMKKEQMQSENTFLKTKINAIRNRNSSKLQQLFSSEQVKKQSKRYVGQGNQTKMQIITDLNNGENIKFVLPSSKHNSFTFNVRSKDNQKHQITPIVNKGNSIEKCYKKYTSFSVLKQSQKDPKTNKQILYHLPQRNQTRVVIYKKTLILNSMQSCLLELSLINQRMLIVAYMMGVENGTIKQLLPLKRTSQILREYENNYEELCNKITIDKLNDRYLSIRVMNKEEGKQKIANEQEKNKQKAKIQNQFIKRNYYTLGKSQQQLKAQSQKQKVSNVSFQQIQAVVDRLAAPKGLYKLRQLDKAQRQRGFSDYQKLHKNNEHSYEQIQPIKKIESVGKNNYGTPLNKLKQVQPQSNQHQTSKYQQIRKNKQQEEYQEEFDNPSELKINKNQLQKSKLMNSSILSKKSNNNKLKDSSLQNESSVYHNQFEKQQQQYNGQFEQGKVASQIVKKEVKPKKPAEQVEEQYDQQFGN